MDLADGDVTFYESLFGWRAADGLFTLDGRVVAGYGSPGGPGWNLHAVLAGTGQVRTDPTGATFVTRGDGPTAELLHRPHAFSWAELCTPDPAAATAFYRELFGWDTVDVTMELPSGPVPYTVFLAGEEEAAGLLPAPAPRWLAYVETPDADRDAQRAADLGGAVVVEPFDVPRIGRITELAGRSGERFALMQMPG